MTSSNAQKTVFYCSLLALQFGLQPLIASQFTSTGILKSSIVIATEVVKIVISFFSIMLETKEARRNIWTSWSLSDSLRVAALPAVLYAVQNLLVQYGYIYLDSMTFNLFNQTKVSLSLLRYFGSIVDKISAHFLVFDVLVDSVCSFLAMDSTWFQTIIRTNVCTVTAPIDRINFEFTIRLI